MRSLLFTIGVLTLAVGAAPLPPGDPGQLRAVVTLTGADGRTVPAGQAVVWIPGLGSKSGLRPASSPSMSSREKRFDPRILAVPVGTPVAFPNFDKVFHNVFSLSEKNRFDLGLYRHGASKSTTFENSGLVRVYCNIHPQMAAFIVVVDGAFYSTTGPDGAVLLRGVPAGKHALRAWDEKGGDWDGAVEVFPGRTAEATIVLDIRSWRDAPHKNKYGKSYPPPGDDENRY
jgi:hypothetical protein